MIIKQIFGTLLFVFLLAGAAQAAEVNYEYEIVVNTSALTGNQDYLDFEFSPTNPGSVDFATAALDGFTGDGTLGPVTPGGFPNNVGDVSGTLPGTVTLGNDQYSDYNQAFTANSFFDIFVDLRVDVSGSATDGSTFAFTLFQNDNGTPEFGGDNPLGGPLPSIEIDLDANGNPTVTNNISGFATVQATPEPGSWALLFAGSALLSWYGLSRKQSAKSVSK